MEDKLRISDGKSLAFGAVFIVTDQTAFIRRTTAFLKRPVEDVRSSQLVKTTFTRRNALTYH